MSSLFISDLHLQPERPDITQAFTAFLQQQASTAEALYILGDLFEVWIGDDDDADFAQHIIGLLKSYSDSGKRLFLMHGNRDFLMGEALAEACGATLLNEVETIDLYGQNTVILHGDSLCTKDQEFMAFRQQSRSPQWQQFLLSKPLAERRAIAHELRAKSKSMSSNKAEDIMDVTPAEVQNLLQQKHSQLMIHGHTHRPARHALSLSDGIDAERIVLGDWDTHAWWLEAKDNGELHLVKQAI